MRPFSFRQRVGRLNWKVVSALDLISVVDEVQVDELQDILDAVTFCEFKEDDVKNNTVQSITKLVHIMQLMLEYLLSCQESQLNYVRELRCKYDCLKKKNTSLVSENISFKEDVKIYQRQLTLLRKSVVKYQTLIKDPEHGTKPRIILDPENATTTNKALASESTPLQPVMDSVLKHERETRVFMREMLEDQRSTFLDELHRFMENMQQQQQQQQQRQVESSSPKQSTKESELLSKAETMLRAANESAIQTAAELDRHKKMVHKLQDESREREADFKETVMSELRQRERLLLDRERELLNSLKSQQSDQSSQPHLPTPSYHHQDMMTPKSSSLSNKSSSIKPMMRSMGVVTDWDENYDNNNNNSNSSSHQNDNRNTKIHSASSSSYGNGNPYYLALRILQSLAAKRKILSLHSAYSKWSSYISRIVLQEMKEKENESRRKFDQEKERVTVLTARYNSISRKLEESSKQQQQQGQQQQQQQMMIEPSIHTRETTVIATQTQTISQTKDMTSSIDLSLLEVPVADRDKDRDRDREKEKSNTSTSTTSLPFLPLPATTTTTATTATSTSWPTATTPTPPPPPPSSSADLPPPYDLVVLGEGSEEQLMVAAKARIKAKLKDKKQSQTPQEVIQLLANEMAERLKLVESVTIKG